MMTLCQQSASSSLATPNTMDYGIVNFPFFLPHHHQNRVLFDPFASSDDTVIHNLPFPPPPSSTIDYLFTTTKRDPGGTGFLDDVGGSVDGMMSCTESLGFESCDERRVDDNIANLDEVEKKCLRKPLKSRLKAKDEKTKEFPPPLSSLSQDGKPIYFLRPMRIDGRLQLTEVKIFRPEVLRASRQDGRLRLHLIHEDEDLEEHEEEEEEEMEEKEKVREMNESEESIQEYDNENMQLEIINDVFEDEWDEGLAEGQQISPTSGGRDGARRCFEEVNNHHHHHRRGQHQHDMHVWRQHYVTIS